MSDVRATPEDLERFASELKQFNSLLRDNTARLRAQFTRLGETWQDQEHRKFAETFTQTMRVLDHFGRAADEQIPFLLRKAARLREYLGQR
jgi:uncharacterized protein YukE